MHHGIVVLYSYDGATFVYIDLASYLLFPVYRCNCVFIIKSSDRFGAETSPRGCDVNRWQCRTDKPID